MRKFMDEDFLLFNETAKILYNNYAKEMPICDFHCHLSPREISEDKKYRNITELWLGGDHYKWRILRSNGVDESFITGNRSDKEKFFKWAETLPEAIGNPVYHWTHLELKRFFGIEKILSPETAEEIWNSCNEKLQSGELTARSFITKSKVKYICTTDDPADTLEYHRAIEEDTSFDVKVMPTFRPDKAINIELDWFIPWIQKLEAIVGRPVDTLEKLLNSLRERLIWFEKHGCFISDHALDTVQYEAGTYEDAEAAFRKALRKEPLSQQEVRKYKSFMLVFLGREYARLGWTMQYHIGALRNNSTRMFKSLGPDTGYDSIHDGSIAPALSKLLNAMDTTDELPKTILYCLNPSDNELIASMAGNFQEDSAAGKIQFGSGWWFNDQKDGMERQMEALSQLGLLSRFVGMVTDSRSFASYTRHEYFRRILCNKVGALVENGEYPADMERLGQIVQNICYNNAIHYFKLTEM